MTQLSAQSIKALCNRDSLPLIDPFIERTVINGKSAGLGPASYDLRIKDDLVLGVSPIYLFNRMVSACTRPSRHKHGDDGDPRTWADQMEVVFHKYHEALSDQPPNHALAVSIERFHFPDNISGQLADKSTYARVFVSAMNTYFDPGFQGTATLELVNHGPDIISIKAGDPICQMVFTWLDASTDRAYSGKYQNQGAEPVPARVEVDRS